MTLLEEIETYWDMRSNGFSSAINEEIVDRGERIAEELMELADLSAGSKVLDLGCGPGLFSILLAKHGVEVIGIDYSAGMVEKAADNASIEGVSAKFLKMDAQSLEFEDNTFDAVVTRNVFWALERPEKCYSEIARVLKNGGRGVVMDGNFYLRLYNDDYRYRPGSGDTAKDYHGKHNTDNVDFKIIEDLARNLPLSKIERPAWDVGVLCKSGCNNIRVILPPDNGWVDRTKVIPSFKIIFTKE